jgi:hypothetical protein
VGPAGCAVPTSYQSLLRTAGLSEIVAADHTDEYRATQKRWIDATERFADDIRGVLGPDEFDDRLASRWQTLDAIDAGLLSRFLYCAIRPPQ